MGKHDPERIHWQKVLKLVKDADNSQISIYEIATSLEVARDDPHLLLAIRQLKSQGKVEEMMVSFNEQGPRVSLRIATPSSKLSRRVSVFVDPKEEEPNSAHR